MNHILSIAYAAASIGFILACFPQLAHIVRTKTVEGLSLQTYDMWFIFQIVSMPYIYQSGDIIWFGSNVVWLVYYLAMVVLIEHYRYPHYIHVIIEKVVRVLRMVPIPAHTRG